MPFEHIPASVTLLFIFYGVTGTAALIATAYLLLRRGNAFAAHVTPPMRLRRWAASFFAAAALSHVWWYIFYTYFGNTLSVAHVVISVLDCSALLTTIAGTLLAMLQDRQRPIWPIPVALMPFAAIGAIMMFSPSMLLMYIAIAYFLLAYLLFTIYILLALRQYGQWLRDNYADLENKKVWLSQVLTITMMLMFIVYAFDDGTPIIRHIMVIAELILFGLLLWRVETLPQLNLPPQKEPHPTAPVNIDPSNIEQLLAQHCIAPKLYLQHDLKLPQLAQAIGVNRYYLSQYFSLRGTNYNTYINDLRIRHFVSRYRETIHTAHPLTAQQLAEESGYHSYSTFSLAFKQRMGKSVTVWMRNPDQ